MDVNVQQQDDGMMPQQDYTQVYSQTLPNNESLLKYQIDPEEIIREVEAILKGVVYVEDLKTGEIKEVQKYPCLINDKGRNSIILILKSRLTKIFVLSDLDNHTISKMTMNIGENIIDLLYIHWEEFGIKSPPIASQIVGLVCDTVFATLRKSYLATYLKFLRNTETRREVYHTGASHEQQNDKPPSPFGFLKMLRGR